MLWCMLTHQGAQFAQYLRGSFTSRGIKLGVAPAGVHCASGAHNRKVSDEEKYLVDRSGVMILISAGS